MTAYYRSASSIRVAVVFLFVVCHVVFETNSRTSSVYAFSSGLEAIRKTRHLSCAVAVDAGRFVSLLVPSRYNAEGRHAAGCCLQILPVMQISKTRSSSSLFAFPSGHEDLVTFTTAVAVDLPENWRQYVSLGVICIVILDIVLGSPLLNIITAPMKREMMEDGTTMDDTLKKKSFNKSRERVDSESIAKAALDKAYGASELRDYLSRNKTDKDRMMDLQREIDRKLSTYE